MIEILHLLSYMHESDSDSPFGYIRIQANIKNNTRSPLFALSNASVQDY